MKKISDEFNDIEQIESVIASCYGKQGRCALIKSSQQFILTSDGSQVLNLIKPSNNHIYNLILKSINRHSKSYGDNCKTLFIYICESLRHLFKTDNESRLALRFANISNITDQLAENPDCLAITEKSLPEFIDYFCVLYDLKKFNRHLSTFTSQLAKCLVKSYSSPLSIADDLEFILIHSDRNPLQSSKIFTNGFLLDSKLHGFYMNKHGIKAVFVVKSNVDWSSTTIDIKSFRTLEEVNRTQFFPNEFLETLQRDQINLVFYEGSMNEFKKQQLNSRNCSFVCFLNIDFIRFITTKMSIRPIYEDDIRSSTNFTPSSFNIDSIETVEKDIYFYRINSLNNVFVYFCSPLKAVFTQFKSQLAKVAKTLSSLFDGENNYAIRCNRFESSMAKFFSHKLINETCNSNDYLVYQFLRRLLESLDFKLNNHCYSQSIFYEPLNLKIAMLSECLTLLKIVSKIDFICFSKRRNDASLDEEMMPTKDDDFDDY